MKKILPIFLIIILLILLSASFFWIYETRIFVGRASQLASSFSPDNSYVFTTPLRASGSCSEGEPHEAIRVYIFVLNSSGLGVPGRRVLLQSNENLIIKSVQAITDTTGKAIIDASSCAPGEYTQRISIDGVDLPSQVKLIFQ